jgi:hypothetical protein
MTTVPYEAKTPNWWGRNWKWFVPLGCLTIIVLFVAFIGFVVAVVFGAIKSTEVYKGAVSIAMHDPRVEAALGTPVEEGWLVSGNVNVENDTGQARLSIPLKGPRGGGNVELKATKEGGKWSYQKLLFRPDSGDPIDLLQH